MSEWGVLRKGERVLVRRLPSDRRSAPLLRRGAARVAAVLATMLAAGVLVPPTLAQGAPAASAGAAVAAKRSHVAQKAYQQARKKKKLKQRKRALQLLTMVNSARSHGRRCGSTYYPAAAPLRYNLKMATAARKHARDLGRHAYFSHTGRSGSTPTSRVRAAGYRGYAGENIAAGRSGAAATMRDWLASPGHCANIMSRQYRHLGIGYASVADSPYRTYWVQDFGFR